MWRVTVKTIYDAKVTGTAENDSWDRYQNLRGKSVENGPA